MRIENEYGIFTSNDSTGQTAQEVYDEWLVNKNKPPQPTLEEQITTLKAEKDALAETLDMVLIDILPTLMPK